MKESPPRAVPAAMSEEQPGSEHDKLAAEIVDWEVRIESPPVRRSDRVIVTFREAERRAR